MESITFASYKKLVLHPIKYRLFLLTRLPLVFFTGIRIREITPTFASVSVKYKWLNQNPFHSLYFAVLAMAAELSTGTLCMGFLYQRKPTVSMLIVNLQAAFYKKATGTIVFKCEDGQMIHQLIEEAISTGEGKSVECKSIGYNENNEVVAVFNVTWSFKVKK
ncbi:MAG: DUF4442 domain-containing protein [Bacteroidetes bacterium]|nr:DUF4442 domain-containing protein [Bacteroidota bacterium]